jgi:hypothetical protein
MFQGKVKTEWLTKGALSPTGGENNGLQHKKMTEGEGGMNREKKIIMEKLILQEKKIQQ